MVYGFMVFDSMILWSNGPMMILMVQEFSNIFGLYMLGVIWFYELVLTALSYDLIWYDIIDIDLKLMYLWIYEQ